MKRKKIWLAVLILIVVFLWSGSSLAQESDQGEKITLEDAIQLTLTNNVDLKLLQKQIDARELDKDKADFYSDKMYKADEKIRDGWQELSKLRTEFEIAKSAGLLTPEEIPLKEKQLLAAEEELRKNSQYRLGNLANAQVTELYQIKAGLGLEVTRLGYEIGRQKYALLTRQKYCDVLKAQRLVAAKTAAVKRSEVQAKMAKDCYQAGFRAKDDMLMAQAQLSLMQADLSRGENDLKLAEIELKKVMGVNLTAKYILEDDLAGNRPDVDLALGLDQALKNRVEIKKAEAELTVAQINMELAKRYTAPNTFDYRQIQLDLENAQLVQEQAKQMVEEEVRSSYSTVLATRAMLNQVNASVKQAGEALEIAEYRYKEGYGMPTSVLKSLNMEDAGGTIFEVLAAQEKLCEIEEKVVEITYSNNLAESKYEVDIYGQ